MKRLKFLIAAEIIAAILRTVRQEGAVRPD
jgi:hypothetical protein